MSLRLVLLCCTALLGVAVSALTWEAEPRDYYKPYAQRYGAKMVEDEASSTNKALRIPYQAKQSGWNVEMSTREITLHGKNLITLYVRGEEMLPLSDGLEVIVTAHDKKTGEWTAYATCPIYGINLKPEGYTALTFLLDTGLTPTTFRSSSLLMKWRVSTPDITPVLYLDYAEIRAQILDTPFLTGVAPAKVRYAPGEKAAATVTLTNPTEADATLTLVGEERTGLTGKRQVFTLPVTVKAGGTHSATAEWMLGPEEYGREIAVTLLAGTKGIDSASGFFAVTKIPLWLSTGNTYDVGGGWVGDMHSIFYVTPATVAHSAKAVEFHKQLSPGGENWEFFSWAPGDIADLAPREESFPGGEGRIAYRSKALIKQQNALLTAAGFWPVSYVNGTVWADAGYRFFQQHPDWITYDANGEISHYEMDLRARYLHKDDADFDPETYPSIFFQAVLNHTLPEVQDYIARQYIACGKEMGFKGVRMDVRYLETHPGEYDFAGKEIVRDAAEADRISAATIKRVKELVHKELPGFTFGYNFAAPEEVTDMPLTAKERCADGGWMLDELPCTYQSKSSPFHTWAAYVRRMTSWGDQINKWGGIYNPYDFQRGSTPYPVDKIYSTLFRLIAGGRISCYLNSRQPVGDLGRFSTKYSECFFGHNRTWLPEIKGEVEVKADAPLWWKDMVYWNRDTAGNRQLLVNLVNPPKAESVEDDPRSELRPPVRNITLTCAPADGKSPKAAWLLTAEPMEPFETAAIRQIPLTMKPLAGGKVSVTVPSVIFYKLVVFQY
jgi:hypothetical protein